MQSLTTSAHLARLRLHRIVKMRRRMLPRLSHLPIMRRIVKRRRRKRLLSRRLKLKKMRRMRNQSMLPRQPGKPSPSVWLTKPVENKLPEWTGLHLLLLRSRTRKRLVKRRLRSTAPLHFIES